MGILLFVAAPAFDGFCTAKSASYSRFFNISEALVSVYKCIFCPTINSTEFMHGKIFPMLFGTMAIKVIYHS